MHIVSRGFRRIFRLLFSVNPLLEERREVRCRNLLSTGIEEDLFCHKSIASNISNLKSTHIIFTHIRLPHLPHLPHFIHPDCVCHLILTFSCKEKDEVKCTKIHGMTHRGRPAVTKPTCSDDLSSLSVNSSSLSFQERARVRCHPESYLNRPANTFSYSLGEGKNNRRCVW